MSTKPTADELRAIGEAAMPPHRRVEALLRAHGLTHGRRARRRFYRRLRPVLEAMDTAREARAGGFGNRALCAAMATAGAAWAAADAPAWFLRWLALERPWRHPERWREWPLA